MLQFLRKKPAPQKPVVSVEKYPVVKDEHGAPLVCYGCGHSVGMAPYPSHPSGERPCMFCIRNPDQAKHLAKVRERLKPGIVFTARYDNGPCQQEVADQYIATDRISREVPEGTVIIT